MLIALSLFILSLFDGGPSCGKNLEKLFADMQHRVEQTAKNEKALKTMEAIRREVKEFLKRFNGQVKELSKLLSAHDTKKEKFEQLFEKIEKYNKEAQDTILKKREELKSFIAREEWGKIFND